MADSRVIVGDYIEQMPEWHCKVLTPDNAIAYSTAIRAELAAHAAQEAAEEYDDYTDGDEADEQRVLVIGLDSSAVVWWVEGEREGEPDGYRRDWFATVCGPVTEQHHVLKGHVADVEGQRMLFEED